MRIVEKIQYITCPNCGAEYLPCEIYYPNSFLGESRQVDKVKGKIVSFSGNYMDLEEKIKENYNNIDEGNLDIDLEKLF